MHPSTAETASLPFLTFSLCGEDYGVEIFRIREIIRHLPPTRIPATPEFFLGVINLRGEVIPVIDLAVKLGLGEGSVSKWSCIIVVDHEWQGERIRLGIQADSVKQMIELAEEDIEEPPSFGMPIRLDFLKGLGKSGERFVVLLDLDKILSEEEMKLVSESCSPEGASGTELSNEPQETEGV